MERKFKIGDRVICKISGVYGTCISFYVPTSCEEQTMVLTDDGRRYHAPTSSWEIYTENCESGIGYADEASRVNMLNPYGEYVVKYAQNHGLTILEAVEEPMVKARKAFFEATGM